MNILTIKHLSKSFGTKRVLNELCMCVPEHSIFGFVGRNGAGKTTTMKSVLGLLRPDSGEIFVADERVSFGQTSTNRHIGYLPDVPEFYSFMTPWEYLRLCGESTNMEKADIDRRSEELLSLVGLAHDNRRIKGFSRGMKQRLGIAQALLSSPRLLICDEPTSALDPIGRKEILDILLSVREQTTVLFSTHILSDVERICTDVALLHEGRIAMQGSVDEIKSAHRAGDITVETLDDESARRILCAFERVSRAEKGAIILSGNDALMFELLELINREKLCVRKIERAEPSLETLFVEVVNK